MRNFFVVILLFLSGCSAAPKALPIFDGATALKSQGVIFTIQKECITNFDRLFSGKAVLVHYWASWCGLCKEELDHLKALREAIPEEKLSIILIATSDSEKNARRFLHNRSISIPTILDEDGALAEAQKISELPATYILDKTGKRMIGWDPEGKEKGAVVTGPRHWELGWVQNKLLQFQE